MQQNVCVKNCSYLHVFAFYRKLKWLVIRVSAAIIALIISA